MLIKNTENRFGIVAIFIHWLMAIIIIGLLTLGLYMVDLPVSLEKLKLYGWHKEYGILILMLVILRLSWRLANITPSLAALPWFERFGARSVHFAFYFFMFAMPLTGWMISSAANIKVSFFGLFILPDLISPDDHLRKLLTETHEWLAYFLIATIILHTAAALKHYFINKDDILQRIFKP